MVDATTSQSARARRTLTDETNYIKANQKKGNDWISMCKRSDYDQAWLLDSEKEIWLQSKLERKRGCRERKWLLDQMQPMPFEEWYQETKAAHDNLKATRNLLNSNALADPNHQSGLEQTKQHDILHQMANYEMRGLIDRQERTVAQEVALATLKKQWQRTGGPGPGDHIRDFEALASEVRNGACVLTEGFNNSVHRVVAVMALHLDRGGNLLAEIAQVHGKKIIPMCRLPGAKQMNFEPADETLRRELHTTYAPLREGIHLTATERECIKGKTESYGLTSVYEKTIQSATMDTSFPLPQLPVAGPKNPVTGTKVPPQFSRNFVFALLQGGKLRLFSWLQHDVFTHLSSPEGKAELASWIGALEIDEDTALGDLAWTKEYKPTARKTITNQLDNSLLQDIRGKFAGHQVKPGVSATPRRPSKGGLPKMRASCLEST